MGELAVAFNTMLDEIQQAFSERDATEGRLRQFLADASHELRTPLTSIQGFAELFRLGADNPRGRHGDDHAGGSKRNRARMKGLVEDLLLLARLDQVRQSRTGPVDLSVLAADACSDATSGRPRPTGHPSGAPTRRRPGRRGPSAPGAGQPGDQRLEPHSPGNGHRCVGSRRRRAKPSSPCATTGPGLDDEALEHVFDRFWQKDPARSGAGAGLGLAIVAAVAAEHDGSVTAANAPGRRSRVHHAADRWCPLRPGPHRARAVAAGGH